MKNWKSCMTAALALAATTVFSAEPLRLQWGTIDTSGSAAQAESATLKAKIAKKAALARARKSAAPEERAAYIVQFPGPVTEEWRTWLESSTQVRGYLPEFAYLVWATATEMETIAANPDVFWTGEWHKEYKTVRARTTFSAKSAADARWMHIASLLVGDDGAADLRARLEALGAPVRSAFARLDGSAAVARLGDDQIDEVADWPDVEWIEPIVQAVPCNDKAVLANMMDVEAARASLSSGGLGLTGEGQTVAVADTGLDIGSTTGIHPDFAGRVVGYAWTNGNYNASASWKDIGGHGTHVCGSVLGSGAASSNQYRGVAYEANLVIQGCWTNLSGIPQMYLGPMLQQAARAGARIHSDSWGYGTNSPGAYFQSCPYIDAYMWTNQNFLMVIAAGNEGVDRNKDGVVDPGSVSAPGTAKNCLCVGAAENWRSSGGYAANTYGNKWSSDYPAAPVKTDTISQTNAPQGLAAFSGRGPTTDGRIKPDIVAPGTDVVSARSRATAGTGWGVAANTNYLYMGGTSMATPLTAGALALIRQWLVDRKGIAEPPAALMKALLVNGARDMTPGQYGTGAYQEITARPDRSQGFGHVDLCNSLSPGDGNFLVFATNLVAATYADFTTNLLVGAANAGTYAITLAWQDYPGDPAVGKVLVNDLDLIVTAPSGNVVAYPNGLSDYDRLNNVEFLEFTAAETGVYTVKVYGENITQTDPHGGQPFALVMRGPKTVIVDEAPVFAVSAATETAVMGDEFDYDFMPLLSVRGYPEPSFAITSSLPDGAWEVADSIIAFTPASTGTVTFACTASNTVGTSSCTLTVTVGQVPPDTPAGLALSNVSTTSFDVAWSPVPGAGSYLLDAAAVSGSGGASAIVEEHFSSVTSSNTDITAKLDTYTTAAGWTGSKVFNAPGQVRLGSGNYNGWIATPARDIPADSVLSCKITKYGSDTGTVSIKVSTDGGTNWSPLVASITPVSGGETNTYTFAQAYTNAKIQFASSAKRFYLDDIVLSAPATSYSSLPGYPRSVGSATNATVTGLSPSTDYAVRVLATNAAGASAWSGWLPATTAAASGYADWLAAHGLDPSTDGGTTASNGMTYYQNYIADIDPTNTIALSLVPTASGSQFTITPDASSNRYYQFIYSTNLAAPDAFATNNLGMGATNASSISFPADWYGSIRVLLDEPPGP